MMSQQPFLVATDHDVLEQIKMQVLDTVLHATGDGTAKVPLMNQLGACQKIEKGMDISKATPVDMLDESSIQVLVEDTASPMAIKYDHHYRRQTNRKAKLKEYLKSGVTAAEMTVDKQHEILPLLEKYHDVFSLMNEGRQTW